MTADRVPPCHGHARHWFAYRGYVGSSSPVCIRYGCNQPNPNYDPACDPFPEPRDTDPEGSTP